MAQSNKEYRINEKTNKELFLHYFPIDEDREYLKIEGAEEKADKKTCIYCGSIHVRQYDWESCGVCEDCRKELLDNNQEFENELRQAQKNLKQLMEISIDFNMEVVYWKFWRNLLQQGEKYFRKSREQRDGFGKKFMEVRIEKRTITFIVHGMLPRSLFIYLITGYMVGIYLKKKIPKLSEYEVYRPLKYAIMKWGALHYMYLSGYTNFCRWKNLDEQKDIEYKELTEKIGLPLENNRKDISKIILIVKEKIDELEGKESKEETEKAQEAQESLL